MFFAGFHTDLFHSLQLVSSRIFSHLVGVGFENRLGNLIFYRGWHAHFREGGFRIYANQLSNAV